MSNGGPRSGYRTLAVVLGGCFAAWLLWFLFFATWILRRVFYSEPSLERLAQLGDVFGGINALFTAFAFAAVWWTGHMQRAELRLQHLELSAQSSALEVQAAALQDQRAELLETRAVLRRQTFEAVLFRQLDIVRQSQDRFWMDQSIGLSAFTNLKGLIERRVIDAQNQSKNQDEFCRRMIRLYDDIHGSYGPQIDVYIRSIFHLLKLIDNQIGLSGAEKYSYVSLVRSQISDPEVVLICLNSISPIGAGFRLYVEKYALLKHMPTIGDMEHLRALLDKSAFGQVRPQGGIGEPA